MSFLITYIKEKHALALWSSSRLPCREAKEALQKGENIED